MADSSTILKATCDTSETPQKNPDRARRESRGSSAVTFKYAIVAMTTIFTIDFAKLKRASPDAKDRWSHLLKRGTIRFKSGVMGFTVKRNPTWMTFPRMATMKTTTRTGSAIFASQLMNAIMRPALRALGLEARERK